MKLLRILLYRLVSVSPPATCEYSTENRMSPSTFQIQTQPVLIDIFTRNTGFVKMIRSEPKIIIEKDQENSFAAYATMEYLLDKLKLLNYEVEFLPHIKLKPIHKYYFVVTKNSGEQFYLFTILAAWLIRKIGKSFQTPEEYDDPNSTIEKIMAEVKALGMHVDFPPNKLKQGVGEHVVNVLDFLANTAIQKQSMLLQKPKPPEEKEQETETIEDESELNLDRVEEEMMAAYSDDSDDENIFRLDNIRPVKREVEIDLQNNVDEESWQLEVERVLPLLKVTIKNENRDWRSHLEQMKIYKSNIDETLNPTKGQLEKLHKEIASTLEKISNREKYLNRELDPVLDNYRAVQDQLSKIKEKYRNISTGVAERNRELNNVNNRVESIKQQMEERGSSMTDGTPLVNIKKSIAKIKTEITDMDVRIGVLECLLHQIKVREEKRMETVFDHSISVY